MDYPRLLVLEEKHSSSHFHIPDEVTLHRVALSILKGRHKQGCWYFAPAAQDKPKLPDYTNEAEIEKLRGAPKDMAKRALSHYKTALNRYEQDKADFAKIKKALKDKDGAVAWEILQSRQDAEYEDVTLVEYDTEY